MLVKLVLKNVATCKLTKKVKFRLRQKTCAKSANYKKVKNVPIVKMCKNYKLDQPIVIIDNSFGPLQMRQQIDWPTAINDKT